MDNKIRIEKKDIYVIEVNDDGDTIEFDLVDIELPYRLERAYQKINEAQNNLNAKLTIIKKQQDHKIKGNIMTANEEAILNAYRDTFKEMRVAFDHFAGEGASQKIFGDRNYIEMFNDVFEQLEPHFEKMKMNTDGIAERLKKKYGSKDESVLK